MVCGAAEETDPFKPCPLAREREPVAFGDRGSRRGPRRPGSHFAQWPDAVPRKRVLEYRLAPRESAWRTTLDGSARYESLPAGRYRFEVRDRFGSAQTWEFRLAETFPYTMLWWFGSAGLAPAGWLVWRRQVRARYWKEKTEFLALQKDDEAAVERSGELVAGRYRVESEIGQGGFARVWKALDVESGATVAIKFLVVAGELDQWQRERFEKETGALLRLRHPGIVRLLDSGGRRDRAVAGNHL